MHPPPGSEAWRLRLWHDVRARLADDEANALRYLVGEIDMIDEPRANVCRDVAEEAIGITGEGRAGALERVIRSLIVYVEQR